MEGKPFGKGLFGYKKKDVMQYIENLTAEYENKLAEKEEDIKEVKRQNQTLAAENADLFRKVKEYEAEREHISNAVISAEIRAAKVLEEAKKEADNLLAQKNLELQNTQAEIDELKAQITSLKLAAVATVRKYEAQFEKLVGEASNDA